MGAASRPETDMGADDVNSIESHHHQYYHDGELRAKEKGATDIDGEDMSRMGKRQELRRNFKFLGIVGFVTILQATWENILLSNYMGLFNGGRGGVIWCTIAVWLLMLCMIASLAEMASMAPTSGGQYHWVSEFAPRRFQEPLSYVVGWCCCLGWITGVPSCCQQLAGMVTGLITLVNPNADVDQLWQVTLLIYAFIALSVAFNIFFAQHLPLAEGIILFVHVFGFFVFLLAFWIMGDHASASDVFTTFHDGGGWGNIGLSCLVGLATPVWCFIGPDAGAHMSEELKDASVQLPKAMVWATVLNGILGITMLITFCILADKSSFPVVDVIQSATGSYAATCVLGSLLIVLVFFSTVTTIASASRQVWAFSRDRGFPFSSWIRYVAPEYEVPVNSLLVVMGGSMIIAAINFGSDVAFSAVVGLSNAALAFTYIISVGCIRLKRLRGEPLLPRSFSLGKFGGPINDITLVFLVIIFIFSFFPESPSVGDAEWAVNFNWASVMFSGTCILALAYYVLGGGRTYVAPVELVKQE
ncbi:amino acid transporter [Lecanosticta acicola]|uniref:Amino acid transporter n=1 Tax=Lecanosticta acicola TaxID=111012 RepID=A0AAI8Z392_9PEZI|nr:amino acid transporter [Lecanosticta acicola]